MGGKGLRSFAVLFLLVALAGLPGCDSGGRREFHGTPPPRRKVPDLTASLSMENRDEPRAPAPVAEPPGEKRPESPAPAASGVSPAASSTTIEKPAAPKAAPPRSDRPTMPAAADVSPAGMGVGPAASSAANQKPAASEAAPPPSDRRTAPAATSAPPAVASATREKPSPPEPVPPRSERPITPLPPPADVAKETELRWVSNFGPGGMIVPPAAEPDDADAEDGLTSVTAVVFPEATRREVLFVGVREPDRPVVRRSELLDAFVLAYRALGQGANPGVSIDPRPGQLSGGLREGDLMDVVYFGDSAGSELGMTAFEADRVMKCLSLGKDNVTGKPMACSVAGYQSELALSANRQGEGQSWHRFWIEMNRSEVLRSADGRTWMVQPKLAVNTEYMEAKGGKLVSGNRPPDPAAQQFADHLAKHYAEYARECPALAKLAAFAAVTSVAAAVHEHAAAAGLRQAMEGTWRLHEHRAEKISTPATTPATVATATTDRHVVQLTGGVRLKPNNEYPSGRSTPDALTRAVDAGWVKDTRPASGIVQFEGLSQQVLTARPKASRHVWQEDLRVGSLAAVREWGPREAIGESAPGWFFRMPRVRLSEDIVDYKDGQRAPRSAFFYDEDGTRVALPKFGSVTLPGNPATAMFSTADGLRQLCLYKNVWLYMEGKIDFVSVNGGPPQMRLGDKARVIRFAAGDAEKHRVEEVQGPQGRVQYQYENGQLVSLRDQAGNAIRFNYDEQGRLKGLEGSNGRRVDYHLDAQGRVRHLTDEGGKRLTYVYSRSSPDPVGVIGDFQKTPAEKFQPASQVFVRQRDAKKPARSMPDGEARYVSLEQASGQDAYVAAVQGGAVPPAARLQLPTRHTPELVAKLAADLAADPSLQGAKTVVLGGDADVANDVAIALRKAAPHLAVFTTASPESAQRNLYGPPAGNGKARVLVYEAKLDRLVRKAVAEHEGGDAGAGTVIVVGHNQPGFIDFVRQQGNAKAFQGRDVVLLTCGDEASNMPGVVEDILNNYGAVSVTGFNQAIRQQLLPHLVDGITSRLTQTPAGSLREGARRKDQTLDSVIRATVEEIRRRMDRRDSSDPAKKGGEARPLPASVTPNDIDALEFHNECVYRQGKPGRFLVQAAPLGVIMGGGRILSGVADHSIVRLAA